VPNRLQFKGRELDETNLYYNRARYYDPVVGRFISEDPLGLDAGINQYAYEGNDPVNRQDPSGLGDIRAVVDAWFWEHFNFGLSDALAMPADDIQFSLEGGSAHYTVLGNYDQQQPLLKRVWDFNDGRFVRCPNIMMGVLEGSISPNANLVLGGGEPGRIVGWRRVRGFLNVSPVNWRDAGSVAGIVPYAGYAEIHTTTPPIQFYGGAVSGRANCLTGTAHFEGFSPN
jgi:RHS repeat-associated protein